MFCLSIPMDQKKVIIASLLILAVILSLSSIVMNSILIKDLNLQRSSPAPSSADVSLTIVEPQENSGGNINGLG